MVLLSTVYVCVGVWGVCSVRGLFGGVEIEPKDSEGGNSSDVLNIAPPSSSVFITPHMNRGTAIVRT